MADKELLQLCGTVEEIIYRNGNNGYTVITVMSDGVTATAVGNMSDVNIGDEIKLVGNWKTHTSYGEQFAFEYYEQFMPSTSESILKYLSSGVIKGIGRATARRLVDAFGEKTLEVIQNEPNRLVEIKGISNDKAAALCAEIRKAFGMREVMLYLEKYRISTQEAVNVWKTLGADAISLIESDPYILCEERINVSFERADYIAAALDKPCDDKRRIRAGIIYIITYNSGNGHTCLPREKLVSVTAKFLKLEDQLINDVIEELISDGGLVSDNIEEREFIFLPSFYKSESYAAGRLLMMLQFPPERITGIELFLEAFEKQKNITYAKLQRKAIIEAMSGGLLILTGGPGTGKTTTLNAIIELYKQSGIKVALAAPTGRAAQRMSEVTGCEAKTIHRLLEVEWDKHDRPVFTRNEKNMLDCDALILDELSMVDATLFEGVLRALRLGCRLIMVGDSDQLPSVGAGNVLGDLISSGKIPVVQLKEIFRQSMKSLIVTNAHRIVHGEMPETGRTDSDFFFMSCPDRERIASTIVDLCSTRLPASYGYSVFGDIQVLCPGRKGELGVTDLNKRLQNVLNPSKNKFNEIQMPVYNLRLGDKVMQTKNNYDLLWVKADGTEGSGVFNGDIGVIEEINKSSKTACIRFDDKVVMYDTDSLMDLELAYAATVHKSQGNEFNAVIIPMYYGAPQLYYRNLLYTAVTRAKKILILVGNISTLRRMVDNNKKTLRYSGLKYFIERGCED
ncbi:MAG: ATP-dependent RecD-like DNA helicase [Clostridia bacterium]|nr:ATP-dependent RecD-like DNA helicase [Clostridia bacterium]